MNEGFRSSLAPGRRQAAWTVSRRSTSTVVCGSLLALGGLSCQPPTRGGAWECIAPAAPGGGWDLSCRTLGRALSDLGLSPGYVQTTNKAGAGGGVAFAHVVSRRAGDPALLVAASPATLLRLAQGQYGDFAVDDVRWVAAMGAEYGVVAVAADAPWVTLGELMTDWRADTESIVVSGGSAVAGQDHVKVLLLARAAGIDPLRVRYVPFDGGGEAMTALLGNFVQLFSGEVSEVEAQVEAGRLRVLAVLAPERIEGPLASVPTARELGYDVEWVTWRGFYAPPSLPPGRYDEWVTLLTETAESPAWIEALRTYRLVPFFVAGPDFERFVRKQTSEFYRISREIGILP